MAQTKAQLVVGLNVNASAPASALQIDASGNVNLDSNTLYVDATNNRVGIGTSSPSYTLDVTGSARITSASPMWLGTTTGDAYIQYGASATTANNWTVGSQADGSFRFFNGTYSSGTERLRITSSGNVGIGSTSPSEKLTLSDGLIRLDSTTSTSKHILFHDTAGLRHVIGSDATAGTNEFGLRTEGQIVFGAGSGRGEAARIDASKRLLVGTSSARDKFFGALPLKVQIEGSETNDCSLAITRNDATADSSKLILAHARGTSYQILSNNDAIGDISWQAADGNKFLQGAHIRAFVDNTPGVDDMPTRLVFSVTSDGASSPTERVRITSDGTIRSSNVNGSNIVCINNGVTNTALIYFQTSSAELGKIRINGAGVAYDTTSDYRLKENIEPITDAVFRLQALKPWRFNFISHPDVTVDGFLAHEAQEVVPEAVGGTKDEVDDKGNPVYQGIDQSKLVPLLTAALQEAIAKIESLEARLTAAGI